MQLTEDIYLNYSKYVIQFLSYYLLTVCSGERLK
jgi:hypothetical protein